MAEGKNSILIYTEWIEIFESLQDDEAGRLIKHLFRYINDKDPIAPDRITELSFIPIKQSLKRALRKWESELENKSNGGKLGNLKRWHIDLYNLILSKEMTLEKAEEIAKSRIVSHTDNNTSHTIASVAVNVSDSVSVPVSVNVKKERKRKKSSDAPASPPNVFYEKYASWFRDKFQVEFDMKAKDWVGIAEIKKYCEQNAKGSASALESFGWILSNWDKLPTFFQQNKNPSFIASKISEIIAEIKKPSQKPSTEKGKQEKNNDVFASLIIQNEQQQDGKQIGH